ncbi:hypothetical protein OIU77_013561 [Salix suchowensis]|uniref:Uncharacterized protein n=1 Tax=Salix suchowensis TaxID=1278906 RepID=A0ABQ8ZU90_9ROSI|nr:hypothetical protein OIU77_013561 [Salix suchowensis]
MGYLSPFFHIHQRFRCQMGGTLELWKIMVAEGNMRIEIMSLRKPRERAVEKARVQFFRMKLQNPATSARQSTMAVKRTTLQEPRTRNINMFSRKMVERKIPVATIRTALQGGTGGRVHSIIRHLAPLYQMQNTNKLRNYDDELPQYRLWSYETSRD